MTEEQGRHRKARVAAAVPLVPLVLILSSTWLARAAEIPGVSERVWLTTTAAGGKEKRIALRPGQIQYQLAWSQGSRTILTDARDRQRLIVQLEGPSLGQYRR